MLERFRKGYEHYLGLERDAAPIDSPDPAADDEHRAVLELLLATMFANAVVTDAELAEIDRFGADRGWNTPSFSFVQAMGAATARVRQARESDDGIAALLADASRRITDPTVRASVYRACLGVAQADGAADEDESAWLSSVAETFGA
jgi:hypothetical protein